MSILPKLPNLPKSILAGAAILPHTPYKGVCVAGRWQAAPIWWQRILAEKSTMKTQGNIDSLNLSGLLRKISVANALIERYSATMEKFALAVRCTLAVRGYDLGYGLTGEIVVVPPLADAALTEAVSVAESALVDYLRAHGVPPITLPLLETPTIESAKDAYAILGEVLRQSSEPLDRFELVRWLELRGELYFANVGSKWPGWLLLGQAADEARRWRLCHG